MLIIFSTTLTTTDLIQYVNYINVIRFNTMLYYIKLRLY